MCSLVEVELMIRGSLVEVQLLGVTCSGDDNESQKIMCYMLPTSEIH